MKILPFAKIQKETSLELFRYALVGVITNILGYTLYLILTFNGFAPKITITFLYAIFAFIGFFLNKIFTFSIENKMANLGVRYLISHLFGYLLNFILLIVFVDLLGYPHQIVQFVAIFVVAAFLFSCMKFFVFKKINSK